MFSAPAARAPLLGVFALLAEWRATLHADVAPEVAATKLAWWRDEIQRLRQARPVHPIGRYLLASVTATPDDWEPLVRAIDAAARQAGGAMLDTAADRIEHADALIGGPLRVAATLAEKAVRRDVEPTARALEACTRAIATGEFLTLTAAGAPDQADALRAAARREYVAAVDALPTVARARYRGLLVLAVLEAHHLSTGRSDATMPARLSDLCLAWRTARRAARADPRTTEIP